MLGLRAQNWGVGIVYVQRREIAMRLGPEFNLIVPNHPFDYLLGRSSKSSASFSVMAPPNCSTSNMVTARLYQRVTS